MNPAQLLSHFDRINEAPDAIPRLRQFILELAVRGKLIEQVETRENCHNDYVNEPTSEELPANWRQLNFGKFCDIQGGNQPPKSQFVDEPRTGYVRLFQIRDLGESPVPTYIPEGTTNRFCRTGEILIGRYGASVGKIFWAQEGAYNVALAKFIYPPTAFVPQFAFLILKSGFFQAKLTGATRSAQAGFNKSDLADIDFPLPSLTEQHCIVAKVDELMALCDRLEGAQTERESRRDRLVASSLHHLNNGADPDTFREHARFYFNHLPRLTTRPDHIQQLRQTILNLAVRGKLVSQDPTDEPAFELLKRVATQKKNAGIAKTGRDWVSDIAKPLDEAFFAPHGWTWTRIGNAVERVTVGYVGPMKNQYVESGIPFLRSQNVRANRFREEGLINISRKFHQIIIKSALAPGDVVVVRSGNVGTACVIPPSLPEANCSDLVVVKSPTAVEPNYLCFYLNSLASIHIEAGAVGVALTHFNTKSVATMPLPLPPLAEQHRIVAKVDELMALCDQLETQLTITQIESQKLMEAILHETLANPKEKD